MRRLSGFIRGFLEGLDQPLVSQYHPALKERTEALRYFAQADQVPYLGPGDVHDEIHLVEGETEGWRITFSRDIAEVGNETSTPNVALPAPLWNGVAESIDPIDTSEPHE